jgi:hypothetical protein
MAAGLDISRTGNGIAEVDSARLAAHYRTRSVDMRQAEGMTQFVRSYVKQHLANIGPAPWVRRVEIDFYGQANNPVLISVDLRFGHLMIDTRGLGESNQDVSPGFIISPAKGRPAEYRSKTTFDCVTASWIAEFRDIEDAGSP